MSGFRRATKSAAKLRLGIYGPSGSGKTFSALRIATGLGGSIAVIDTERGASEKYADRFEFDVQHIDEPKISHYIAAFEEAKAAGYSVLIIDSLSHAWHELLEAVDRLARAPKYRGNKWAAWSEATPHQRKFVDAILEYPGHVLATMRSKTEWATEKDERSGHSRPIRLGLAPEQRQGVEYEFDLLIELSTDHVATVQKDRTGKFQDATIDCPDEAFGRELAAWLSGEEGGAA
jgi:hypothetical protein